MENELPIATVDVMADYIFRTLAGEMQEAHRLKKEISQQYMVKQEVFDLLIIHLLDEEFLRKKGVNLVLATRGWHVLKQCPDGVTMKAINFVLTEHAESLVQPNLKQKPIHTLTWGAKVREYFPLFIPLTFIIFIVRILYEIYLLYIWRER